MKTITTKTATKKMAFVKTANTNKKLNLNQQSHVRTGHVCVCITVHNYGTQYCTEQTSHSYCSEVVYWIQRDHIMLNINTNSLELQSTRPNTVDSMTKRKYPVNSNKKKQKNDIVLYHTYSKLQNNSTKLTGRQVGTCEHP